MLNYLIYNGTKSTDLGVYVTGSGSFDAAEMDAEKVEIAGRNGDFIIPKGRYKNIPVTYPAFIPKAFQGNAQNIRNWMRSATDYARLEDTYDPDHFRLGLASGIQSFEPVNVNDAANFQLSFDCDPRRFLKSGDSFTTFSGTWSATNPTDYPSRPQIAIGDPEEGMEIEVTVDGRVTTFTATDDYTGLVIIDCETQDIYDDSLGTNLNYLFTISGEFPQFKGTNSIELSGNYSAASVRPRWWEL